MTYYPEDDYNYNKQNNEYKQTQEEIDEENDKIFEEEYSLVENMLAKMKEIAHDMGSSGILDGLTEAALYRLTQDNLEKPQVRETSKQLLKEMIKNYNENQPERYTCSKQKWTSLYPVEKYPRNYFGRIRRSKYLKLKAEAEEEDKIIRYFNIKDTLKMKNALQRQEKINKRLAIIKRQNVEKKSLEAKRLVIEAEKKRKEEEKNKKPAKAVSFLASLLSGKKPEKKEKVVVKKIEVEEKNFNYANATKKTEKKTVQKYLNETELLKLYGYPSPPSFVKPYPIVFRIFQ